MLIIRRIIYVSISACLVSTCTHHEKRIQKKAEQLVRAAIKAHGGLEHFYHFRNACVDIMLKDASGKVDHVKDVYDFYRVSTLSEYGKRNFFLFAFPFKLADAGVILKHNGIFKLRDITYDRVLVLNSGDEYDVYFHPQTRLVEYIKVENDPFVSFKPVWIGFSYKNVHGLQIANERRFYRDVQSIRKGQADRSEVLSEVIFWCRP